MQYLPDNGWIKPCVMVLAVWLVTSACRPPEATRHAAPPIVLEAEDAIAVVAPFVSIEAKAVTGGGRALAVGELTEAQDKLRYAFATAHAGQVHVWLRAWWRDGCSNSVEMTLDQQIPAVVGNDGTYRVWHWVRGPRLNLPAGQHRLTMAAREPHIKVDQIVLSHDADFVPRGILGADGVPQPTLAPTNFNEIDTAIAPAAPPPVPAQTPPKEILAADESSSATELVALPAVSVARKSVAGQSTGEFMVGLGGYYAVGWEPVLIKMGVPFRRLPHDILQRPDLLAKFDVVCMTRDRDRRAMPVLEDYVRGGGTLIAEAQVLAGSTVGSILGRRAAYPFNHIRQGRRWQRFDVTLSSDGSSIFPDFEQPQTVAYGLSCHPLPLTIAEPFAAHGRLSGGDEHAYAAVVEGPLGQGQLYYLALEVGFSGIRGTIYEQVARQLLTAAIGDRWRVAAEHREPLPEATSDLYLRDDFMRREGDALGWREHSGKWSLSGDVSAPKFTLKGAADNDAVAKIEASIGAWQAPRLAASIATDHGQAGIWLGNGAEHASFEMDQRRGELCLRTSDAKPGVRVPLPPPEAGWRRLSLYLRDGIWTGFVDGVPVVTEPFRWRGTEPTTGGLMVSTGVANFDDVHVCHQRALLPGRDRSPGEEGSDRCVPPLLEGLEFRSIYSPAYDIRPVAQSKGGWLYRHSLPTFTAALVMVDGAVVERLEAALEGPRFQLGDLQAKRELAVVNLGARDYVFGGQLVDWYSTGGSWHRQNRWACDPNWQWLGVAAKEPATLWYRHSLTPPYALRFLVAESQRERRGHEKGRDMNLVVAGNGEDLTAGLRFRLGMKAEGASLHRADALLAKNREFTPYTGHKLHHMWIELVAIVEPKRLRIRYDGETVFDEILATPLERGKVGFWTQHNESQIARATIVTAAELDNPMDAREAVADR